MFSGIITELGIILTAENGTLSVKAPLSSPELVVGASIAINGTCLTATECSDEHFKVDVIPETARLTNLSSLNLGAKVNLELPLKYNERIGGHLIQGHIDGTGTIAAISPDGSSKILKVDAPSDIMKYVFKKGFVAIDGASLTVADKTDSSFTVAIIPHTLSHSIIGQYVIGTKINIETDIIIKGLQLTGKG